MNTKGFIYVLVGLIASGTIVGSFPIEKMQAQRPHFAQNPPSQVTPQRPSPVGRTQMGMQHDRHFIEQMIPHHQGAVEMADLALSRAKHPELKQLAAKIEASQTQEIRDMQVWYKRWYGKAVPPVQRGGMGMMGMGRRGMMQGGMMQGGMMGMQMDLTALKNTSNFDRDFMQQMIPHHQMAVMMSAMILNSPHPELRSLAQAIIKSQSAEIQQMQQWSQAWYP
jgi:uncharacterized protein (DUF305 family)